MTLHPEHLRALRMESEAKSDPLGYRTKVFLLGLLGYAFIFLVLLFAIALSLATLALAIGSCYFLIRQPTLAIRVLIILGPAILGLAAFTFYIFQSLWVTFDVPDGMEIERGEAVPLFQEIDRLREQLGVPRFHRVLLTDEFNAAVIGRPRLGLFGWQEYSLIIGIPLMATLSPDRFRAVLAHEMGHIAAAQGRFNGWVYRLWQTWINLLITLHEQDHGGATVFLAFFAWYAPLFDRYTFALRRLNEYESDKIAAKAVGARTVADALLTCEVVARSFHEQGDGPIDHRTVQRWINDAMQEAGDPDDTHPSLAARLHALGQTSDAPAPIDEFALTRYLGHRAPLLAQSVGIEIVFSYGDADPVQTEPVAAAPAPAPEPATAMPTLRTLGS